MKLQPTVVDKIRSSNRLKGLIAAALDKTTRTVENYCDSGSPMLTTAAALQILRRETGLRDEELMIEEQATA